MSLNIQHIQYRLPNQAQLLLDISFSVNRGQKAAIIGRNGAGKSTLLQIIAGKISPDAGVINRSKGLYYVPQHYGQYDALSVAEALGIDKIIKALDAIETGSSNPEHYDLADNNWDIKARLVQVFKRWGLEQVSYDQAMNSLSGGMKTKVFLAGIELLPASIILLDEPTNHLDLDARTKLYAWLSTSKATVLLISHDKQLLRLCDMMLELENGMINSYGGNYDLYEEIKQAEISAKAKALNEHQKAFKEAKRKQQEVLERKQRATAHAERKVANSSDPKILLNTRKAKAEQSTSKLKLVHAEKLEELKSAAEEAAAAVQMQKIMTGFFGQSSLHQGKILIEAERINVCYEGQEALWPEPITVTVRSGDRIAIAGNNGTGKSTLMRIFMGVQAPSIGAITLASFNTVLLDQDYRMIDRTKTVLEQALEFNCQNLEPADVHRTLAAFMFLPAAWTKSCSILSGGEMLRLSLCCMVLQNKTPDVIFLDEPLNNLDIQNIDSLTKIFSAYKGTLVVISHDVEFLNSIGISAKIQL